MKTFITVINIGFCPDYQVFSTIGSAENWMLRNGLTKCSASSSGREWLNNGLIVGKIIEREMYQ
jgi:hypothetical protein